MNASSIDWRERAARLAVDGRALIDGRRVDAHDGRSFDCVSPIDGRVLGPVARGAAPDVDAAVGAARAAFEDGRWARQPPAARKRVLQEFARRIEAAREEWALLETRRALAAQLAHEPGWRLDRCDRTAALFHFDGTPAVADSLAPPRLGVCADTTLVDSARVVR